LEQTLVPLFNLALPAVDRGDPVHDVYAGGGAVSDEPFGDTLSFALVGAGGEDDGVVGGQGDPL
jgi:hypothetical protein